MAKSVLKIQLVPPVATVTLNRPEVRNAMHIGMIRELTTTLERLEKQQDIRILCLNAAGPDFCSGADLQWMREGMDQSETTLRTESLELAGLFRDLASSRLIVIVAVHGRVMGGAIGLVAASDITIAESGASFAFSEVRLGLIPATIAPYVIGKVGYSRSKELMLSGRVFTAESALKYGLVHSLCLSGELEAATSQKVEQLLHNGPEAMSGIKLLLNQLNPQPVGEELMELTAALIAKHRISGEGQKGMRAFFEKRKPSWDEAD